MDIKNRFNKILENLKERFKHIQKRSLYCVGVGIVFGILSFFLNNESIYIRPNEIKRNDYGMKANTYKILTDVENLSNDIEFNVQVSPKRYTEKEALEKFDATFDKLKIDILGENEDYEHINKKLRFDMNLQDGIKANYTFIPEYVDESDDENDDSDDENTEGNIDKEVATESNAKFKYYVKYQNLIDGNGNVKNNDFRIDEICNGYIEIQLQTEIKDKEGCLKSDKYMIPIKVVSKNLSTYEKFVNAYKKEVIDIDEKTIDRDTMLLPKEVDGFKIRYKEKKNLLFLLMPIFGVVIAFLLNAKDIEKIKDEEKKKKRRLMIDFTQIISKVLLYVSSGMTIRNAFIRIADNYRDDLKKGNITERVAYNELLIAKNKMSKGYSEIKAYEEMANNINLRIYTRFLNIIIQSIKNGNKDLKNILNMEVQDALYERKQRAKKLGEEATTKLVLPLMMMLSVIMIVIMVPAFMGM